MLFILLKWLPKRQLLNFRIIVLEKTYCFWVIYANSNTFHVDRFSWFESMQKLSKFKFKKVPQLLIVWIVTTIVLENKKWFWVIYANSNTFLCSKFFLIRKYAKVIQIQKLIKFIAEIENDFARQNASLVPAGGYNRN